MLDPQLLRTDIDAVAQRLSERPYVLDKARFQAIEQERKTVQMRTQELQAGRNQFAKRIGAAKAKGEDAAALMAESAQANTELAGLEKKLESIQKDLESFLLDIPNAPHASVPSGRTAEDNVEQRRVGEPRRLDFT